jgi:hypothetical protein
MSGLFKSILDKYQEHIGQPFVRSAPGQALSGYFGVESTDTSPEAYRTGQALGNMPIIGGPAKAVQAAGHIPEALGMIIGPKAVGGMFKHGDAIVANKLLDNKAPPNTVFSQSGGYFKDDKTQTIRRNIDDRKSTLDPMVMEQPGDYTIGAVLSHPELMKAYPGLKDVQLVVNPALKSKGEFDSKSGIISVNPTAFRDLKDMHSTLLHEIQHFIQKQEGWQGGGNSGQFKDVAKDDNAAKELYRRLKGEVDARSIQRQFLKDQYQSPNTTTDVNPKNQIDPVQLYNILQKQETDNPLINDLLGR